MQQGCPFVVAAVEQEQAGVVKPGPRAAFAAGAIVASALWFNTLGWGARFAARWPQGGRARQVVNALNAFMMVALAMSLLWPEA